MWGLVLPLTGFDGHRQPEAVRVAALAAAQGVLEQIVDARADHEELWSNLVPIVAQLPERCQPA